MSFQKNLGYNRAIEDYEAFLPDLEELLKIVEKHKDMLPIITAKAIHNRLRRRK